MFRRQALRLARGYASGNPPKPAVSDYLVGLQNPGTRAEADKEAESWLSALQELKKEYRPDGRLFSPSKVFAPENATDDWSIFDEEVEPPQKIVVTPEQQEWVKRLEDKEIPALRDETMNYLANVIMRHGRKAQADRYLNQALYLVFLRTRNDPVTQLRNVLEQMAPVVRLKRFSDGGARAELVPVPMTERQRLHQAWTWILEASDRHESRDFPVRLAEEIIRAINGNSSGFDKKKQQHKTAIANRAYVSLLTRRRR